MDVDLAQATLGPWPERAGLATADVAHLVAGKADLAQARRASVSRAYIADRIGSSRR